MSILAIFLGGGLGSVGRYGLGAAMRGLFPHQSFPFGTLLANVLGAFLLGLLVRAALDAHGFRPELRAGLTTGFCGGLTTYSTFNLEVLTLFQQAGAARAAVYLVVTLVACGLAGLGGFWAARTF